MEDEGVENEPTPFL